MVKWIICLEIGTFLAAGSCKQFGWDLSVFTSMRKFQWLMGRNFRAHWWRISGNHNICQPLKVSHKRTNSMDTERYMLKLLGWGVWEWVRSTCCIIFTSSETGEKSKSNSREREKERNSPRRKGLANCWLAGVRVRDENGCSVGGNQTYDWIDIGPQNRPAIPYTHLYMYARDIWRRWALRFPRQRAGFFSISTLRRVPLEQGHI